MTNIDREYDVLIVGAGVAGVHAAFAAARRKADVLLVTSSWETAAALGWGPRFADTGKLKVKAKGAVSTGPPAAAIRAASIFAAASMEDEAALVDSDDYQGFWRYHLEKSAAVTIFQDTCESLSVVDGGWAGETGWGVTLKAKAVVLAVGTFLGGRVACGNSITRGGRPSEAGAENLEACLSGLGVELRESRRRAGPTFDARSIEWNRMAEESVAAERAGPQPVFWADGRRADGICLEPINKKCDQHYLRVSVDERLGVEQGADMFGQLAGLEKAHMTKPGFAVSSVTVPRELVNASTLNYAGVEALFLAGRIIGADSYGQSAYDGLIAGVAAAAVSRGT